MLWTNLIKIKNKIFKQSKLMNKRIANIINKLYNYKIIHNNYKLSQKNLKKKKKNFNKKVIIFIKKK